MIIFSIICAIVVFVTYLYIIFKAKVDKKQIKQMNKEQRQVKQANIELKDEGRKQQVDIERANIELMKKK